MKQIIGLFMFSILFIALKANDLGIVKIIPESKERFVKINDPLSVKCITTAKSDTQENLKWTTPSDIDQSINSGKTTVKSGLEMVSHLTIKHIKKSHLGNYKCAFGSSVAEFELKEATEDKMEANFTLHETAVLSCKLVGIANDRIKKVEWYKNDTLVSELSAKNRYTEDEKNRTLTIVDSIREDADLYTARYTLKDIDTPYDCNVAYLASPLVLDFEKSKNLIEDDTMELQCKVKGYPRAVVQWLKNDKELNVSDSKRIILSNLNGYQNARLVIKSIQFDDAGDYTCKAYSEYFNTSDSKFLIVRVKDKLAALWPFLGIVGEVIILCTIIFIYEKRRNKQAESNDNDAQDVDGSTTDKKEGLRHRNTQSNNPTA